MKFGKWMALLAAASLLAGCKGFWDMPAGSSNGNGSGASSGVFYVANQATDQVAAFSIVSGELSGVSGSPYALSVEPQSLAIAPNGNFLYVGTLAGGTFLYSIGSGGALTIGNGGQAVSFDLASEMAVDPSGSWLVDAFVTLSGGVQVDAIPITSTGTVDLTRSEQTLAFNLTGASVNGLAISPDGNYVFVAAGSAGTLVVPFAHGNSSPLASSAVTIQPLHTGGSALSVAVDSTDRLFYIGETLGNSSANSGGLRVFNYSSLGSGTLTQAGGSPIASGGLAPTAILPIASGDYVYVANGQGTSSTGNIQGFAITNSGTATAPTYSVATSGSSVSAGTQPAGLAEDNSGTYVLAINSGGSPDLNAFTISNGALTLAFKAQTGTDPVQASAIAALPPQ